MNSRLMLSLWRERWGKAAGTTFKVPYVRGKVNQWIYRLPHSAVWSVTGVPVFVLLSCLLLLALMMGLSLSFNDQVIFSVFFICVAVYLRRYAGTLVTLVLAGMSFIASTRYLYWRFDATLTHDFSLDFIFGFYFFVAECYLGLMVSIGLIQSIWPLKREYVPLPHVQGVWPTVDVFILCYDQPYAAIKSSSMAARNLDWPKKKIKIYLIDGDQRDDLQELASTIGAFYLPHTDDSASHADFINLALPSTKGELIAVFESGQVPDKSFLQSTVGWFLRDHKLGMAQTPHHFLSPAPSKQDLEMFNPPDFSESCAMFRRSILLEVGGVEPAPVTEQSHMALKLHILGYGSAYLGFKGHDALANDHQYVTAEPKMQSTPEIFLIEHSSFGRTSLWKRRFASFHSVLQFYYFVPRLLFFTAPLAYLLGHIQIIQTSVELFVAYALPHFLHAYIARTRTQGRDRFTLVSGIRETVLAWYILMSTAFTMLRAAFNQCLSLLTAGGSPPPLTVAPTSLFAKMVVLPYIFVLCLNLAGFFSGMAELLLRDDTQREVTTLYLLWSVYNLMLLAAILAVAEEAKQVRKHTRLRLHMPAMIKLPSGRTISCATENFPESVLGLSLPMPVVVDVGSAVSISIFHGHRELVFPATVVFRQELTLRVNIADAAKSDYQTFAVDVLSRGPEWQKWLPGRGADRPFPKWVTDAFAAVPIVIRDFATSIINHLHWARMDGWIQLWKKRND